MLIASADPTIIAAGLTMAGAVVAGMFAFRSRQSADLVDGLMEDRKYQREQINQLRAEVDVLNANSRATETALLQCRESEAVLRSRVAALEGQQ